MGVCQNSCSSYELARKSGLITNSDGPDLTGVPESALRFPVFMNRVALSNYCWSGRNCVNVSILSQLECREDLTGGSGSVCPADLNPRSNDWGGKFWG